MVFPVNNHLGTFLFALDKAVESITTYYVTVWATFCSYTPVQLLSDSGTRVEYDEDIFFSCLVR